VDDARTNPLWISDFRFWIGFATHIVAFRRRRRPAFNPKSKIGNPKSVEVVRESVGERARHVAVRGVDEHAGGLDDDEQLVVLEEDVERQPLGRHRRRLALVVGDLDRVARFDLVAAGARDAVHRARAAPGEHADAHAAQGTEARGQKLVEPPARLVTLDLEAESLTHRETRRRRRARAAHTLCPAARPRASAGRIRLRVAVNFRPNPENPVRD
jgi:hypothetical protein